MKQLALGKRINTWAALSSLSLEGSGLLWLAKGRRESLGPGDRHPASYQCSFPSVRQLNLEVGIWIEDLCIPRGRESCSSGYCLPAALQQPSKVLQPREGSGQERKCS